MRQGIEAIRAIGLWRIIGLKVKSWPATEPLNPGGAIIPFFLRYDSSHLSRYAFAVPLLSSGGYLDYGCGYGAGTAYVASMHSGVSLGVDIDPKAIAWASAHFRLTNLLFRTVEAGSLPVVDGSIGLVTAFDVIEHLYPRQLDCFLEESTRALDDTGILLGSTPNAALRTHTDLVYHTREFAIDDLFTLATAHHMECRVLGLGRVNTSKVPVLQRTIETLPAALRRAYLLKIAQSLVVAIRSEPLWKRPAVSAVEDFTAASTEIIFMMTRKDLSATRDWRRPRANAGSEATNKTTPGLR